MSSTSPVLFQALVDDAAVFPPAATPLAEAVRGHRRHRAAPYAACVGPLLVPAAGVADLVAVLESREAADPDAASATVLDVVLVARPGAEPTLLTAGVDALHRAQRPGCGWSAPSWPGTRAGAKTGSTTCPSPSRCLAATTTTPRWPTSARPCTRVSAS